MPTTARRVETFGTTIFTEVNVLAQQHHALNLGQGKPDFDTPPDIVAEEVQAFDAGSYIQYAPGPGAPALQQAVAHHATRFYGLDIDPARGVVVTAGGTEGIFAAVLGLTDPGDEVIVIEPFYDSYVPNIIMANATRVFVALHPPTWTFDPDELRKAFSSKTRALILNTPQNPTGRVFTKDELITIAELCIEHDVTVISDEVYEHLTFGASKHIPISTLPGMFERTVVIGSAGKMFSATGWKIGWVYGTPALIEGVSRAHQFITFAVNYPTQQAVAYALNLPDSYYSDFKALYEHKLALLCSALEDTGFHYVMPEGTYFLMADFSSIFEGNSTAFARYLITKAGVACIPPETFYSKQHASIGSHYIRFAFCKNDETLLKLKEHLIRLRE